MSFNANSQPTWTIDEALDIFIRGLERDYPWQSGPKRVELILTQYMRRFSFVHQLPVLHAFNGRHFEIVLRHDRSIYRDFIEEITPVSEDAKIVWKAYEQARLEYELTH